MHIDNDEIVVKFAHLTVEEKDKEYARLQLKNFFPMLNSEDFKVIECDGLMRHTLNRVLASMLHLDTVFDMNATFEMPVFEQAVKEAIDYKNWLESEDIHLPESLKYISSNTTDNIEDENDEDTTVKKKKKYGAQHNIGRKPRSVDPNSKFQKCIELVKQGFENKKVRHEMVDEMVEKFQLGRTTADTYFSKIKSILMID